MKLLHYTQSAGLRARSVGAGPPQELPLDLGLQSLVLEAPDIPRQPGVLPLPRMLEVSLVVAKPRLEGGGAHAHVPFPPLANSRDPSLVDHVVVFASRTVHWATFHPSSAVAVGVVRPLVGEVVSHHLGIVSRNYSSQIWHRAIREPDRVPVEGPVEGVARREAGVEDPKELLSDLASL